MAKSYTVKILSPTEWERVTKSDPRYEHVTDDNMGFADPEKRVGYVRNTYFNRLNAYLMEHEFEHLLEDKGTDEDSNGIRHKRRGSGIGRILGGLAAAFAAPFTGGSSLIPFML